MNLKNSMLSKLSHMHNTTYFIIVFIRKTQKSKSIEKKSRLILPGSRSWEKGLTTDTAFLR